MNTTGTTASTSQHFDLCANLLRRALKWMVEELEDEHLREVAQVVINWLRRAK